MPPVDLDKEELERLWQAVAFRVAVETGDTEKVDEMLENGINPNSKVDGCKWTVLMLAANAGRENLVEKFAKGGRMPKVEDADPHGFQAIMLAALKGHEDICKTLLDKKADANSKNEHKETPLMMASAGGHTGAVQLLLAAKADPDAVDKHGMSAGRKAARWGHLDVMKLLLPSVSVDAKHLKQCLLLAKLYEHPDLLLLLDPPEEEVTEEEAAVKAEEQAEAEAIEAGAADETRPVSRSRDGRLMPLTEDGEGTGVSSRLLGSESVEQIPVIKNDYALDGKGDIETAPRPPSGGAQ